MTITVTVKKKTLSGAELLARLQGWLRRGWVEEHNTLGGWDTNGRRIKGRFYTTRDGFGLDYVRFDDKECGPFPAPEMMVEIAATLGRAMLLDEDWPPAMFTPAQSRHHIIMDIIFQSKREARKDKVEVVNTRAWERYGRLQTLEAWQKQGRIKIDFHINNQKNRSTAVVKFGQYERREDASAFPSPEMVANIALALGAGADQK